LIWRDVQGVTFPASSTAGTPERRLSRRRAQTCGVKDRRPRAAARDAPIAVSAD